MGLGAAVGGGAVLSFGPIVRSRVQARAARYGATVAVEHVVPDWKGVRLRGVEVTVEAMPGVRVRLDEVVVGWDKRPRSTTGGKILAVGTVAALSGQFDTWKSTYLKGGEGGGTSRKLAIDDFALEWKSAEQGATQTVSATGLSVSKEGAVVRASAATLAGAYGQAKVDVAGGSIELVRDDGGYRIAALTTAGLELTYDLGERPAAPLTLPATEASAAVAPPSGTASASSVVDAGAPKPSGADASPPPRVLAARRARAWAVALAEKTQSLLGPDAVVALDGASARLGLGAEVLHVGPGKLTLTRTDGDWVVALAPSSARVPSPTEGAVAAAATDGHAASDGQKPLTFSVRVPFERGPGGEAPEARPFLAEVHGGPVWLSMLGLREGDFGLRDVHQTRLEADVTVVLPPGEEVVSIDGRGRIRELSIADRRLAEEPLTGVALAFRTKAEVRLDGSKITLADTEVDLGDIRFLMDGTWERQAGEHKVALDFVLPLMTCESAFASIPKGLVTDLEGMRFAGSLSLKGHARFDTANIKKAYDVSWDGTLSCRVTHAPAKVAVTRFKTSFEKVVYTPDGQERMMTFGPNTESWVPLSSIAHFMSGSVLVTEDGRFHRHRGFDHEAIVNSIQQNIEARRFVRGASTISMQLAKNLYLPRTKTLSRKLQEAILTLYLEQELTKRELMELYLNVIEYGPMVYGIGPAAKHYFNSHPARLSLSQSMYLASILRNPKQQFFGAGGAVTESHMRMLRLYMKILHKIGRITEEELDRGVRETVVFGTPAPIVAPPEDDDGYPLDGGDATLPAPGRSPDGPTFEANAGF